MYLSLSLYLYLSLFFCWSWSCFLMIPFSFARLGFGLEGRKALNPEQWICNIVSDQGRPRAARAVMSHSFLRPLLVLDYEWSCVLSVLKVLLLQHHRECNLSLFGRQLMGKVQCDPQLFSQHSFVVCELMKLLHFLSQRLHWTAQLLWLMWAFKASALLKAEAQFSHSNALFSPKHFIMWEFLLL